MPDLGAAWFNLKQFDELAKKSSVIHRVHPVAKLLTTLVYIVLIISFGKTEIIPLFPLVLYPLVVIILGNLPVKLLFQRLVIVAPLVLGIGLFNPWFDQSPAWTVGPWAISSGWLSLVALMFRFGLTTMAALVLVATSGIEGVGMALLKLKVPRMLVLQLLLLHKYLHVLFHETLRLVRAYELRSAGSSGITFRAWGSLAGQLLLRTFDRGSRSYQAMDCRGFDGEWRLLRNWPPRRIDIGYVMAWSGFFLLVRWVNIPEFLGQLLVGVK